MKRKLRANFTVFYPGANSAVVDAAVAQPIEVRVVGVDKMIYMKSTSGGEGSYMLTAFARHRFRIVRRTKSISARSHGKIRATSDELDRAIGRRGEGLLNRIEVG